LYGGDGKKKGVEVTAEVVRVRKESRSVDISDAANEKGMEDEGGSLIGESIPAWKRFVTSRLTG
jgi:hypothetical protein